MDHLRDGHHLFIHGAGLFRPPDLPRGAAGARTRGRPSRAAWSSPGPQIRDGQNVWQSTGGQELGSVWGHGAYIAPDWSADWLHREAEALLTRWSRAEFGRAPDELATEQRAGLEARLQEHLRRNTYDPQRGDVVISDDRAAAIALVATHYAALFGDDPSAADLREDYAMRDLTVSTPERRADLAAFFFWTAWACVTERPGQEITYTNNWPPDDLVGNRPAASLLLWTGFSVILLIAGIAPAGLVLRLPPGGGAGPGHHAHQRPAAGPAPDRRP